MKEKGKREGNPAIYDNPPNPRGHYAKWKKPAPGRTNTTWCLLWDESNTLREAQSGMLVARGCGHKVSVTQTGSADLLRGTVPTANSTVL